MTEPLSREQVEWTCTRLRYPTGAGGEREAALVRLLDTDAALRDQVARLTEERVCTICGTTTDIACSDCRIDLRTTVFVCTLRACQLAHETKCPGTLRQQLAAVEQERDEAMAGARKALEVIEVLEQQVNDLKAERESQP